MKELRERDGLENHVKLGPVESVGTLLRITRLAHRKSDLVIICPNSHEKLTNYEIRSLLLVPIWFDLPLFGPKIKLLSIFSLTYYIYHYLPIFGLI